MELNTFDDLLTELGTGKWNLYAFIVASCMYFIVPMQTISGTYLNPKLGFTCKIPDKYNSSLVVDDLEDRCSFTLNNSVNGRVDYVAYQCEDFQYDNSTFHSTMTSEFDLVCEYNSLRATYFSIYSFGILLGSPVNGFFADRIGRKMMFALGSTPYVVLGVILAWLPDLTSIFVSRFIMGFTHASVIQSGFLLATEVCQIKHRSTVGILVAFPWALGTMVWGGLGYMIRDWRYLQMASAFPTIVLLPFVWFVDESPRWLIVRGKFDKAMKILQKAADWNNKKLPSKDILMPLMMKIHKTSASQVSSTSENTGVVEKISNFLLTLLSQFRSKNIRNRSLILCMDFFVTSMIFYGLSINSVNFNLDPYIYMILGGLMEAPSYSLTAPIIQTFGRKVPLILGYLICGVSILALTFIPNNFTGVVITLAMVGKLCIASIYQTIYLYGTELIPTEIRQFGMGNCNVMARIGSICSPYIVHLLGLYHRWVPSLIFGSLAIICGFCNIFIPETLNKPIPETLAELEADDAKN